MDCLEASASHSAAARVSSIVLDQLKKVITDSEIMKRVLMLTRIESFTRMVHREDDSKWPEPSKVGRQELEVVLGDEHISFTVSCSLLNREKI